MKDKVKAVKRVYPHFELNIVANNALKNAKSTDSNTEKFFLHMTTMLFCSFTIEAYINHVGISKVNFWQKIKKNIGPEDKLEILSSIFNYPVKKNERPFKTLKTIVQFRNLMVHAQSEVITEITDRHNPIMPLSKWEKMITEENAEMFLKDTESMLRIIHKFSGMILDPIQAGHSTAYYD